MKDMTGLETKILRKKTGENSENNSGESEAENEAFDRLAADLICFFQKCTLPHDTTKVKRKFEETIELRQKMILNIDQYKPLWDLLLLSPDLVNCILIPTY